MSQPITRHPYLYTGNNPVNRIDPGGEFFGLVNVSLTNATLSNFQISFAKAGLTGIANVAKIHDAVLAPAYQLQEVGLAMIFNDIPGGFAAVAGGRQLLGLGYSAVRVAIANIYQDTINNFIGSIVSGNGVIGNAIANKIRLDVVVPVDEYLKEIAKFYKSQNFEQFLKDKNYDLIADDVEKITKCGQGVLDAIGKSGKDVIVGLAKSCFGLP